jgi:vacuolar protein sorting-associated protein 16
LYYEKLKGEDDPDSLILLIGCYGDMDKFQFESPLYLVQELDCCRIISNYSHEILEQVNEYMVDIFRIGSLDSSALLFDAYTEKKNKQPASIKTIMAIQNKKYESNDKNNDESLERASKSCLLAACYEFDQEIQQELLKASSYGKIINKKRKIIFKF